MTARAIGDVLVGSDRKVGRRTFQPVRRDSRHAGEPEQRIWRPLGGSRADAARFKWTLLKAAKHFELTNKPAGRWNGPLGAIGLQTLECLLELAMSNWKTGALDPAIDFICSRIRRSRAAVVRALARLRAHGFLDWVRRTEPIDNPGAGPQVRQISNAYGFDITRLPKAIGAWIRMQLSKGPPPDCEVARREQDRAEVEGMLDQATPAERARYLAGDGDLAELLARMDRALGSSASSPKGQTQDGEV